MKSQPALKSAFTCDYPVKVNQLVTEVVVSSSEQFQKYHALWDTGATNCAISNRVIEELQLKSIDIIKVRYGDGEKDSNVYLMNILLPNNVMIQSIRATSLHITEEDDNTIDILVGMDIISLGCFAITNYNNKTALSFAIPSCEKIDFVPMYNKDNITNFGNRKQRRDMKYNKHKK